MANLKNLGSKKSKKFKNKKTMKDGFAKRKIPRKDGASKTI
ncbi:MAG: hypothetical protein CM15mP4_2610 [Candidatus Neomarinimicrobiota bacterium]|nr:MAG: hypothetical protein CM15mP4_2610 [Candidatus Neomarinimicrobiota bacterium]